MLKAAKDNGKKLMVGHCLRFTNEYMYLKKLIDTKEFGKPVKAEFSRKSPLPVWTAGGWILDESKSGGCLVDMHVHDVDVINWLFGVPEKVTASATSSRAAFESAFALYQYPDMVVSAIGDWGIATSYEFEAKYAVTFEKAYVESVNGKVTLYTDDEKKEIVFDDDTTCYYREVLEFVDSVVSDKPFVTADIDSVYETMKIVFAEKEMARK
jgi:predicted dehydrogenase